MSSMTKDLKVSRSSEGSCGTKISKGGDHPTSLGSMIVNGSSDGGKSTSHSNADERKPAGKSTRLPEMGKSEENCSISSEGSKASSNFTHILEHGQSGAHSTNPAEEGKSMGLLKQSISGGNSTDATKAFDSIDHSNGSLTSLHDGKCVSDWDNVDGAGIQNHLNSDSTQNCNDGDRVDFCRRTSNDITSSSNVVACEDSIAACSRVNCDSGRDETRTNNTGRGKYRKNSDTENTDGKGASEKLTDCDSNKGSCDQTTNSSGSNIYSSDDKVIDCSKVIISYSDSSSNVVKSSSNGTKHCRDSSCNSSLDTNTLLKEADGLELSNVGNIVTTVTKDNINVKGISNETISLNGGAKDSSGVPEGTISTNGTAHTIRMGNQKSFSSCNIDNQSKTFENITELLDANVAGANEQDKLLQGQRCDNSNAKPLHLGSSEGIKSLVKIDAGGCEVVRTSTKYGMVEQEGFFETEEVRSSLQASQTLEDIISELDHIGRMLSIPDVADLPPSPPAVSANLKSGSVASVAYGRGGAITSGFNTTSSDPCHSSLSLLDVEASLNKKRYDRRSVTSVSSESRLIGQIDCSPGAAVSIAGSRSTEKIGARGEGGGTMPSSTRTCFPNVVRTSRSQETYFDSIEAMMTCVDIDVDNIASSIDALHYDATSSFASLAEGLGRWSSNQLSELDLLEEHQASRGKSEGGVEGWVPAVVSDDEDDFYDEEGGSPFMGKDDASVSESSNTHRTKTNESQTSKDDSVNNCDGKASSALSGRDHSTTETSQNEGSGLQSSGGKLSNPTQSLMKKTLIELQSFNKSVVAASSTAIFTSVKPPAVATSISTSALKTVDSGGVVRQKSVNACDIKDSTKEVQVRRTISLDGTSAARDEKRSTPGVAVKISEKDARALFSGATEEASSQKKSQDGNTCSDSTDDRINSSSSSNVAAVSRSQEVTSTSATSRQPKSLASLNSTLAYIAPYRSIFAPNDTASSSGAGLVNSAPDIYAPDLPNVGSTGSQLSSKLGEDSCGVDGEQPDDDDDDDDILGLMLDRSPGSPGRGLMTPMSPSATAREVDRESAARLAKRLYHLHGFKKCDVARHLSKKNSFAQLVSEEYLKYFDFTDEALPSALRRFITHLILSTETQDRERLLSHFATRYHICNPNTYKSQDSCHTLACAMLLLNNDLHGQNMGRRMTLPEFVANLADMNDGENFPKEVLKMIYQAIKTQPLEIEILGEGGDNCQVNQCNSLIGQQAMMAGQSRAGTGAGGGAGYGNVLNHVPDPDCTVEYKKGYVMRKCCVDPEGRKTPLGRRGWKMFYATLRDMVLYLHTDEHGLRRSAASATATHLVSGNVIRVHHSLATKATDYLKKSHVFRLQSADMAQYLIQTSDSKECQEWIDAINFVAASYSAPCQPAPPESQRHFQRHILPHTYTKLNLREQIGQHEMMVVQCDRELLEHRKNPPEKGARTRLIQLFVRKENYLKFELKRYKTYCRLLQYKISAFPELEPSLAEIAIGEVDEPLGSSSGSLSTLDSDSACSVVSTNMVGVASLGASSLVGGAMASVGTATGGMATGGYLATGGVEMSAIATDGVGIGGATTNNSTTTGGNELDSSPSPAESSSFPFPPLSSSIVQSSTAHQTVASTSEGAEAGIESHTASVSVGAQQQGGALRRWSDRGPSSMVGAEVSLTLPPSPSRPHPTSSAAGRSPFDRY